MIAAYYDIAFMLSLLLGIVYAWLWHRHFDVHITMIFVLVPVTNLGYALLAHSETLGEALNANRLTYVGGCYLLLFLMLVIFSLCDIPLRRWMRVGLLCLSTAVYVSALTIGKEEIFYRSIRFERLDGVVRLYKDYNWMHTVFYALIAAYFLLSIGAIVYSWFRKNQVSRKTIYLLFLTELSAMLAFFGGRVLFTGIELLPAACDLGLVIYLIIVRRMCLYDLTETAADALVETDETGIVSFDFRYNYLGGNEMARRVFPELNDLKVDLPVRRSEHISELMLPWLEGFRRDQAQERIFYEQGDRIYEIFVNWLFDGRRRRGLQILIDDETADQRYIRLQESFNSELSREVKAKTRKLEIMHDSLILGMAAMVESRDNSTGGHIRRTSDGVRMLIEELRSDPEDRLLETYCPRSIRDAQQDDKDTAPDGSGRIEKFCACLIKAAPMHDLGKIAVDDAVLRKPGRFTPEEYEKMKTHAAEGARIVREILKDTDDGDFRRIAENVAHYHHERWDGSGYPEGLRGEEIPFEARIMAVADVYDALVSKRVYKEKMPFEKADAIILEGMGSQFDPALERFYRAARPKLEAYYAAME